jgi:hypothetical protein
MQSLRRILNQYLLKLHYVCRKILEIKKALDIQELSVLYPEPDCLLRGGLFRRVPEIQIQCRFAALPFCFFGLLSSKLAKPAGSFCNIQHYT